MEYISTDGLIVSVRDSGENDRLISMLTPTLGRIRVTVKGGRSIRGGQSAVTQLFTYGNFELTKRNGFYSFRGGVAERVFFPFRAPVENSALMYYLSEIASEVTDENEPADEIMRMLLNALYLLYGEAEVTPRDPCLVKAAFEIRAATLAGYAPEVTPDCAECGGESDVYFLDVDNGRVLCPACVARLGQNVPLPAEDDRRVQNTFCRMSASTLAALAYVSSAPQKRLYSFSLPDAQDVREFSKLAETYLLHHLDRSFPTLDFYKSITTT